MTKKKTKQPEAPTFIVNPRELVPISKDNEITEKIEHIKSQIEVAKSEGLSHFKYGFYVPLNPMRVFPGVVKQIAAKLKEEGIRMTQLFDVPTDRPLHGTKVSSQIAWGEGIAQAEAEGFEFL